MPKRRANGEGTIYKRPNGTWAGQITINGKRHTVYGRRKQDVVAKMRELQMQFLSGEYVDPNTITVSQLVHTWLDVYKKYDISLMTYNNYLQAIEKYIVPTLGNTLVQQLQPTQLQMLYNSLIDKPGVLSTVYIIMGAALKLAVKQRIIRENPDEATNHPTPKCKKRKSLIPEEREKFLETAKKYFIYPYIILAMTTGLRRGELLGLKWSDIDFENKTITVNRQIQYTRQPDGHYRFVETVPKTTQAYRTVPLPDDALPVLANYKKLYDIWLKAIGVETDFVFITSKGTPLNPVTVSVMFKKIREEAGTPSVSPHVLRHTYATKLAERGVHPKAAQKLLGHARFQTTMDVYTDVTDVLMEDTKNKMKNFLDE